MFPHTHCKILSSIIQDIEFSTVFPCLREKFCVKPFIAKQDITVEKGLMQNVPLGIIIKRKSCNSFMSKEKEGFDW